MSTNSPLLDTSLRQPMVFYIFLAWVFVLIARPQDGLAFLGMLRPALVLGLATAFALLMQRSRIRAHRILQNPQGRLYTAFICIMIVGIPFAYYRGGAFRFLTTIYVNTILFFVIFYKVVDSINRMERVLFAVCLGTALYSLFAIQKGNAIGANRLAFGGFFDPNDLAFFVISFLPYNFLFLSRNNPIWKRTISLVNILISVLLIFMTGSRGGFLALSVVTITMMFTSNKTIKTCYKIIFLVLGLVIILAGASAINFERLSSITQIDSDYNTWDETGRIKVWERGLGFMLSNPLTGVGVSCFEEAIGRDRKNRGLREMWQSPHNSLIQVGAETGMIGLALFIVMSFKAFRIFGYAKKNKVAKQLARIGEMSRLSFLGHFTSAMFLSQAYSVYWVFFIVLSASIHELLRSE